MSYSILLLLGVFWISTSSAFEDLPIVQQQFRYFEKFIQIKDWGLVTEFLDPDFRIQTECGGKFLDRKEFIDTVMNLPSNSSFHAEVLKIEGNAFSVPKDFYRCTDTIRLAVKVYGFGDPVVVHGNYIIPDFHKTRMWRGGKVEEC